MTLNEILKTKRFQIIYKELELPNFEENDIFVGYIQPESNEKIIRTLSKSYTSLIDEVLYELENLFKDLKKSHNKIVDYINEKQKNAEEKIIQKRGLNFDEYLDLFQISPVRELNRFTNKYVSDISYHPLWKYVYDYLGIDQEYLSYITSRYKPTIDDYLNFLEENNMFNLRKILNFFAPAFLKEEYFERHCYITGMTGSGKSELLKVLIYGLAFKYKPFKTNKLPILKLNPKSIKSDKSIVVIDPHGDLAEQIIKWQEFATLPMREPDFVVYIDPFLDKELVPVINPFDIKDKSDENIDILSQELTRVFQELIKDSKLSLQMETLLQPCIATLLRRENSSLRDLQRFMNDDLNKDLVEEGLKSPNPAHRDFFKYAFYNRTYTPTKQSIFTKIQSLLNSQIFHNLVIGKSTIDLEKLINRKKILIFNLSKGKLGTDTSEAFGRLIIALLNSIALKRAYMPEEKRVRTFLFIDEFQNYISKSIETTLTENRKYKLYMILSQQLLGQGMNTQMKNIILSNTFIKFIGMNALNTLKALSSETGIPLEQLQKLNKGVKY